MLLQQLNRSDAERVFVIVQNRSGVTATQGALACWDYSATNVSFGNAIATPQTSNLALFAGVLDADIAADGYVLAQVYGYRASIVVHVGAASVSAAGLLIGPLTGCWSGNSNGRTFALGPIAVFDNDISGPGWVRGFIRAL